MSRYTNITSPYIKKRLSATPWSKREYIDDLIYLHRFIQNPPRQVVAGWGFSMLRQKYPSDYLELLKEESIEQYEEEIERLNADGEKMSKYESEEQREQDALRSDWIEAGGIR
jgi:hypothetical protein